MDKQIAVSLLESLASGIRLDIYRFLVTKGLEGAVAGDIAIQLDIPSTNLSFHLKAMTNARLIIAQQEGRFIRYKANLVLMLDLIAYLTENCCQNHPEECSRIRINSACSSTVLPEIKNEVSQ